MKLQFVHDLLDPSPADVTVALTPTAYQRCLDAGLSPTTLDDHVQRPFIDDTAYLSWQLRFLDSLPAFDGANWESRRLCAYVIKNPIDSLVATSNLLRQAVEVLEPTEVCIQSSRLVPTRPLDSRPHLQFSPLLGDVPLAAQVLPFICAERGLAFSQLDRELTRELDDNVGLGARARSKLTRFARLAYTFGQPVFRLAKRSEGTDIFCSTGHGVRLLAQASVRARRRVLVGLQKGNSARIVKIRRGGWRTLLSEQLVPLEIARADIGPLLREVETWTGGGLGSVLASRLETYLYVFCGKVEALARLVPKVMEQEDVDQVWAANPNTELDFATLQSAIEIGVTRTLIQHGDHLFSYRFWLATETPNFNEMIVSDATVPAHLSEAAVQLNRPVPAFRGDSPRLAEFVARHPRSPRDWDSLPVCYVPCMFIGDAFAMESGYVQDAEYYRWQLRLLDTFSRRSDWRFVWKALPSSNEADDPIPHEIARLNISNVSYESAPLQNVLRRVGRILTDYPSTALFEAAHCAHPLLAVVHERFVEVREEAARLFEGSVVRVDSWLQAQAAVDRFLDQPAEQFIVDSSRLASFEQQR